MYIIPYRYEKLGSNDANTWIAWVFTTNGGSSIWETDEEDISPEEVVETYLEANGLFGCVKGVVDDCLLFEIDLGRTKLSDFYMWTDFLYKCEGIPEECDVWRPFIWIGGGYPGENDEWGWYHECQQLSLGKFGTAQTLWQVLRDVV